MNSETFPQNQKRKEKYSNSKNFVSQTLSQISFRQITLEFATLYIFSFFLVSLYKISF